MRAIRMCILWLSLFSRHNTISAVRIRPNTHIFDRRILERRRNPIIDGLNPRMQIFFRSGLVYSLVVRRDNLKTKRRSALRASRTSATLRLIGSLCRSRLCFQFVYSQSFPAPNTTPEFMPTGLVQINLFIDSSGSRHGPKQALFIVAIPRSRTITISTTTRRCNSII